MPKKRGFFVVLEGPDKSGKSTQAALLTKSLRAAGRKTVHTREPGGASVPFAEKIRELVLNPDYEVQPLAELLLYEAARAQHVFELVRPALDKGEFVVCERFTLATAVYQGAARGMDLALIERLNAIATGGLKPDLTIVLDIPEAEFKSRAPSRVLDRLERETAAFRRRVRAGYRAEAARRPKTVLLDSTRSPADIHQDILARASRLCGITLRSAA